MLWQQAVFGRQRFICESLRPKILQNKESFFVYGSRSAQLGCSLHCTLDHWDRPGCHFISIGAIFPVSSICFPWVQQIRWRSMLVKKKMQQNNTKSSWFFKEWAFLSCSYAAIAEIIEEEKKWKRTAVLHLSFSSPGQHMCEASTFWDFPSCWSRWCQLTPRCAGRSFIRWYDLL